MKTARELALEKARQQVATRAEETWTWEEIWTLVETPRQVVTFTDDDE